jgi:hypothetical protein
MSKTITLITGALVTISLSTFLILGKIDLATFGTFTTAILGVLYGFYQKVENKELNEVLISAKTTIKIIEDKNNSLLNQLDKEVNNNIILHTELYNKTIEIEKLQKEPIAKIARKQKVK